MFAINEQQLGQVMPSCPQKDVWTKALNDCFQTFDINSRERAAAFLAQIAHESGEMGRLVENLNYSAKRLMEVWPKRFPTLDKAQQYERNPEKLANYVYAKRLGNGDQSSGDGWRFRGRGILQITGRSNYKNAALALGLPIEEKPELLEQPGPAALAAGNFWKSRGLNELADDKNDDNDDEDFVTISVLINGGKVGLSKRKEYWLKAKKALV